MQSYLCRSKLNPVYPTAFTKCRVSIHTAPYKFLLSFFLVVFRDPRSRLFMNRARNVLLSSERCDPRRAFVHDVNTIKTRKKARVRRTAWMKRTRCTASLSRMIARQGCCLTVWPHATRPRRYIYHLEVLRGFSSTFSNSLLLDDLLKSMCFGNDRHARHVDILG